MHLELKIYIGIENLTYENRPINNREYWLPGDFDIGLNHSFVTRCFTDWKHFRSAQTKSSSESNLTSKKNYSTLTRSNASRSEVEIKLE